MVELVNTLLTFGAFVLRTSWSVSARSGGTGTGVPNGARLVSTVCPFASRRLM